MDKEEYDSESDDEIETIIELDSNLFYKNYDDNKKFNRTSNIISKYEKTKIISERAQQLADGSPSLLENSDKYSNVVDIANKEYNEKKLPFIIVRNFNGKKEFIKLTEMII